MYVSYAWIYGMLNKWLNDFNSKFRQMVCNNILLHMKWEHGLSMKCSRDWNATSFPSSVAKVSVFFW
jgi:hypothetical protein